MTNLNILIGTAYRCWTYGCGNIGSPFLGLRTTLVMLKPEAISKMSFTREIVTDIPNELRQMLGADEEVYYKGRTKRYAQGGETPTEIFVTNQRVVLNKHKFFGDIIEDASSLITAGQ